MTGGGDDGAALRAMHLGGELVVRADGGAAFINKLVTLGTVVFVIVAAAATLAAPWLVSLYAQSGTKGFGPDELALATAFAYWCLPQVLFYALYSLLGQVLNARRHREEAVIVSQAGQERFQLTGSAAYRAWAAGRPTQSPRGR